MKLPLWFQGPVLAFVTFGFTPAGCPDPTLPRPAEVTHDAVRWPVLPDGTMKVEEKGWRQGLQVPAAYADFKREVKPTAKYALPDFDVECYEQRNGTDTFQRVMMAIPKNAKGKRPAVVVPFYFPEAMLGFNPADGSLESDLVKSGTNLTFYSEIA